MKAQGYRIEKLLPQPEELQGIVPPGFSPDAWVLIRNHDDEPMAVYDSKHEAEEALQA